MAAVVYRLLRRRDGPYKRFAIHHRAYLEAVDLAFGNNIDYSMLVKIWGSVYRSEYRTDGRTGVSFRWFASSAIVLKLLECCFRMLGAPHVAASRDVLSVTSLW